MTLRELQTNLPWSIKYSQDFRSSPQSHKDFAHALHHIGKAAGRLHAFVDDMDHDRATALGEGVRKSYEKYIADLVVCALRMANTFPGGVVDLERAVIERIESKNQIKLECSRIEALGRWPGREDSEYLQESMRAASGHHNAK